MIRQTLSIGALVATAAFSMHAQTAKDALQQTLGQVKQSIAMNQTQLRQYAWTETTEISLKGDEKKRSQNDCRYGPDGKVQKTPIGSAPPPPSKRGIKGKIVANKIADLKEYMDRVAGLMRRYIPPDPQSMQVAFQAGKVTINPVAGALVFTDYYKSGDKVTINFDPGNQKDPLLLRGDLSR